MGSNRSQVHLLLLYRSLIFLGENFKNKQQDIIMLREKSQQNQQESLLKQIIFFSKDHRKILGNILGVRCSNTLFT